MTEISGSTIQTFKLLQYQSRLFAKIYSSIDFLKDLIIMPKNNLERQFCTSAHRNTGTDHGFHLGF